MDEKIKAGYSSERRKIGLCPKCGAEVEIENKFCSSCGANLRHVGERNQKRS